jgi:hypothetical protein
MTNPPEPDSTPYEIGPELEAIRSNMPPEQQGRFDDALGSLIDALTGSGSTGSSSYTLPLGITTRTAGRQTTDRPLTAEIKVSGIEDLRMHSVELLRALSRLFDALGNVVWHEVHGRTPRGPQTGPAGPAPSPAGPAPNPAGPLPSPAAAPPSS